MRIEYNSVQYVIIVICRDRNGCFKKRGFLYTVYKVTFLEFPINSEYTANGTLFGCFRLFAFLSLFFLPLLPSEFRPPEIIFSFCSRFDTAADRARTVSKIESQKRERDEKLGNRLMQE